MDEITLAGLDIDRGMVLKINGSLYHGADAMHTLALLSTRSGVFNRLAYWVFRNKWLANVLYPVCRFFRNMLLKAKRVTKINNLNVDDNDHF